MKIRIIGGVVVIAAGLLIALGPQFLFEVCGPTESGSWMRCHWSAQAEIGAGGVIAALGIALLIFSGFKVRLGLVIGALLSGINALLIPHVLIGGCSMETMQCRKIAFPAIAVISILLIIGAGLYTVYLLRKKDCSTC